MRKMAHCSECKKRRKLEVEVVIVARYCPTDDDGIIIGFGDIIVRCPICYTSLHGDLTQDEIDELSKVATKTSYF